MSITKKLYAVAAIGLVSASLLAGPAAATTTPGNLDEYGCMTSGDNYRCYRGEISGRTYKSRQDMLNANPNARTWTGTDATGNAGNTGSAGTSTGNNNATTYQRQGSSTPDTTGSSSSNPRH